MQTAEDAVRAARTGFEAAFAEGGFYNRQTQDAAHLRAILDVLPVRPGMRILDLGTGSGYLAFALAKRYPEAAVTGLDIVGETLAGNAGRAEQENLQNLHFICYDGGAFPFADSVFDLVVSRYALHHFPEIDRSIGEVSRVLTGQGLFFLSDPAPDPADTTRFIDDFMRVKPDGHIRFYTAAEWTAICGRCGLEPRDAFVSTIRFPRNMQEIYSEIAARHGQKAAARYDYQVSGGEVFVTAPVNNLLFGRIAAD